MSGEVIGVAVALLLGAWAGSRHPWWFVWDCTRCERIGQRLVDVGRERWLVRDLRKMERRGRR